MNHIVYQSLMLSNISGMMPLDQVILSWINKTFKKEDQAFYILYSIVSAGIYPCEETSKENIQNYCFSIFENICDKELLPFISKCAVASIWSRFSMKNPISGHVNEIIELWEAVIGPEKDQSNDYSDIDYFRDHARMNYLRTCYSSISERTESVRQVASDLIKNKDNFEAFDIKYRQLANGNNN